MTNPQAAQRLDPRIVLACWAFVAVFFVVRAVNGLATTPLVLDTDDAMRLTNVHDLLAGQGWYDQVQHRLNAPYGAEIHWSRLVDLPEAVLVALLRIFGGLADTIAAFVWPLGLLLVLLIVNGRLALRLGGSGAVLPALILPAFSLVTMAEFAPGRFDHHGPQIIAGLVMLGAAIGALERPRFAILAGIAAALSLGIGIEGLPMIGATILAFGLNWVLRPGQAATLRGFGISLALASLLALTLGVAPSRWLVPAYDEVSIAYVSGMVLCGMALVALSLLTRANRVMRLIAGIAAAAIVVGIVLALWPALLKGPYGGLDPWLITNWIDKISEAQPWAVSLAASPAYPLAVMIPVLVALAVAGWTLVRRRTNSRDAWLLYALFLIVGLAAMLLQIRAARMAVPLAVPGAAVLIARAREVYLSKRTIVPILGLVGSWCISAGVLVALAANLLIPAPASSARAGEGDSLKAIHSCLAPSAFANLAELPPERIMTPIDLGSHMLLFTPHAVVAAPYHRNQQGVRDAFRFFNEAIEVARQIVDARGIGLVVICPAMAEVHGVVPYAPDSFVALREANALPPWLVRKSLSGEPLEIYSVLPR
ncbi:MAG: hypothetical protein ABL866_02140 [Devosia sp.]